MKPNIFAILPGFCFILALTASAQTPALPDIPTNTYSVVQLGAVGDGHTLNTAAIQNAIATVGATGGTLVFPAGKYLTGPFTLTNRLNLHLDRDAVILISDDLDAHPVAGKRYVDCIYAADGHDIAITGDGTIDGQGAAWWKAFDADPAMTHRPFLVKIDNCSRVLISDVTLRNSPMFHLVPQHCTDVTIRHVTIKSPANTHNTDGIDPSGWNYLITGCTIDDGDDNIAIKPADDRKPGDKNFLVTGCTFLHGHGMSIGSGSHGGLENLVVSNCTFNGTAAGIRIKTGRTVGGRLHNITYEDLSMNNVKNAISIIDFYPERNAPKDPAAEKPQPVTTRTPFVDGIIIRDVTATNCPSAGTIRGLPEAPVTDVSFSNVHISAVTGLKIYHARNIRFSQSAIISKTGKAVTTIDAEVSGLQ
jgi:polygalacturonase